MRGDYTTDGASAHRSMLDPTKEKFYWGEEGKNKVDYAWVNHAKEEFTRFVPCTNDLMQSASAAEQGRDK